MIETSVLGYLVHCGIGLFAYGSVSLRGAEEYCVYPSVTRKCSVVLDLGIVLEGVVCICVYAFAEVFGCGNSAAAYNLVAVKSMCCTGSGAYLYLFVVCRCIRKNISRQIVKNFSVHFYSPLVFLCTYQADAFTLRRHLQVIF